MRLAGAAAHDGHVRSTVSRTAGGRGSSAMVAQVSGAARWLHCCSLQVSHLALVGTRTGRFEPLERLFQDDFQAVARSEPRPFCRPPPPRRLPTKSPNISSKIVGKPLLKPGPKPPPSSS
ncbi:MAG: hypothetical protein U1E33_01735 [Rhodospirillales bacterium]